MAKGEAFDLEAKTRDFVGLSGVSLGRTDDGQSYFQKPIIGTGEDRDDSKGAYERFVMNFNSRRPAYVDLGTLQIGLTDKGVARKKVSVMAYYHRGEEALAQEPRRRPSFGLGL